MTSLASQLKSLALPHTQAVLGDPSKRVSLLFDPTEAANLDKEALLAIGISGLEELTEIDNVFMEYEKSLFNESASGIQRLVQSSEVNRKLDECVQTFLVHLSPYFLLRPAQKTLEWLIFRYQIHLYNIDDLLMCAFPYHDTNIFTRVLQILDLSKTKSKWHWLEPVQKHGTHLPTQTIATHAYKDGGFLNFISSIPDQFISVHGHDEAGGNSAVHLATAFYAKIVLNSIQLQDVLRDSYIAQLTTFLLRGLKSRSNEYKCSAYMILSSICSKVCLREEFVQLVLPLLTKRMTVRNGFEALSCLVFVFNTQPSATSLPRKCFKHLCRLPGVVQHLTQLHEWGVLASFWPHLLTHLVPAVIKDSRLAATSSSDGGVAGTELLPGKPEYWSLFESLMSDCELRDEHVQRIIGLMCTSFVENREKNLSSESESMIVERVRSMLRLLEQKYSQIVDSEIEEQMNASSSDALVEEFALLSVSSFKYRCTDDGTNLLLSLNNPSSIARRKGVEQLATSLDKSEGVDREFVSNAIYSRLIDDDLSVAQTVIKCVREEHMLKYLTAKQLVTLARRSTVKDIRLHCVQLLARHNDVSIVTDDITKLVLISTHRDEKVIVFPLLHCPLLPMFAGIDKKKIHWQRQVMETLAANIAADVSPDNQIEMLMNDDSPYLQHAMCGVLHTLCTSQNIAVDVRVVSLRHLLTLHQMMSRQAADLIKCSSECLSTVLVDICSLFDGWPGHWWTNSHVVQLMSLFLNRLLKEEQVRSFVDIITKWMKDDTFYSCLAAIVSLTDDLLTLNLLTFVNGLPAKRMKALISHADGYKTMATVLSLLVKEDKLVRRTALKLLTQLSEKTERGFPLRALVEAVLAHSKEVKTDPLQLPEVLVEFLNSRHSKADVSRMLQLICDPSTPPSLADSLLHCFDSYRSSSVLEGVQPLLSRLLHADSNVSLLLSCLSRYDDSSADVLDKSSELWKSFIRSLEVPSCREHSLSLVSKSFFASLPSAELKEELLVKCLDVYLSTEDAGTQVAISKLVRRVTLPAEAIKEQFDSLLRSANPDQSMKTKKMRRSEAATSIPTLSSVVWSRARLLLEWLQNKKKIDDIHLLVPSLFQLVTQLLEMEEEVHTDYIKQLLLGCLDNVLNKLGSSTEYKELLEMDKLNVDSVVQSIRTSNNPQTHQQALLLLKTTASLYPDVVLHHVMSIFTYMGANMMRQDDSYSLQIITNTVDTVVPEIVKASDESSSTTITGIIRVFVDAFPHIPEHRRLTLFFQLLRAVGDFKYLYVCAALCMEAMVTCTPIPDTTEEVEWKTESNHLTFMISLFAKFDVTSQVEACTRLLEYLCTLPSAAASSAARKAVKKKTAEGLFDIATRTDKQLRHFKCECAGFVVSLLSSSVFIEQFVNSEEEGMSSSQFNELVEVALRYISLLAQHANKHAQQPTARFWKALLHKAYEILDKVNALLPSKAFIGVITSLVANELPLIRRKALDLLNNRLPQTALTDEEASSLVDLVSTVQAIALGHAVAGEDSEDTTNRQTALYSLKILARIMASSHTTMFVQMLADACKAFEGQQLAPVKANILLLMGELVYQLKIACLSQLTTAVPILLATLAQHELLQSNHLLWISAVMALQKMMESVPTFLSGYLTDILVTVSTHSSSVQSGGDMYRGYKAQLPARLKTLRECAAKEFPPRVLVPAFTKVYAKISSDKLAVQHLMSVVADHVQQMNKDDLASCHHKLLDFLLIALDYRTVNHQEEPVEVEGVEDTTISATLKMVVKLSEASFRPMYFKLCGWATRESEVGDRLVTFYRLSDQIAETLRGLFSLFASHIIKNAADTLNAANTSKSDISSPFEDSTHASAKDGQVCKAILSCLYKCFLYDTDGFVTKQRMNILMQPLVDQLENMVDGYDTYVKDDLVPCLSQLAMAASDDSLWKPLTYQICLKTRHPSAKVRKGALRVLHDLSTKLGEDFMTLLPETIPFLAELMEDEEEEVEALCQEVIANMEAMLGEPLQKYF